MAAVIVPAPATGNPVYYAVQLRSGFDASTAFWVNGIGYDPVRAGELGMQNLSIHVDVLPGENRVEVLVGTAAVSPWSAPVAVPGPGGPDLFAALLVEGDELLSLGDEAKATTHVVATAEWRPGAADEPAPELFVPHRLSVAFAADPGLPPPVWTRAVPVAVEDVVPRVGAELRRLHAALAERELDRYANMVAWRYREAARAFPLTIDAAQRRARDIEVLDQELSRPGMVLQEVPWATLRPRLHAGGRQVELVRPDGSSALQARCGAEVVEFPARFSRLDDALVVTR